MMIPNEWKTKATQDELLKQQVRFLVLVNGTMSAGIWIAAGYLVSIAVKFIGSFL